MFEVAAVCGAQREVVITPAAGRQDSVPSDCSKAAGLGCRARVGHHYCEDRQVGLDAAGCFSRTPEIFQQCFSRKTQAILFLFGSYPSAAISRMQCGQQHCPCEIISKNMPSASGKDGRLPRSGGRDNPNMEVKQSFLKPAARATVPRRLAAHPANFPPAGFAFRDPVVDAGGQIDRHFDADFMAGIYLSTHRRSKFRPVHGADFAGVITPPMVTAGKTGDRVGIAICRRSCQSFCRMRSRSRQWLARCGNPGAPGGNAVHGCCSSSKTFLLECSTFIPRENRCRTAFVWPVQGCLGRWAACTHAR